MIRISRPDVERSVTIGRKALRRDQREEERLEITVDTAELAEMELARPKVRAHCEDAPRPCVYVSCRHNLYLDVTEAGSLKLNFPDKEPDEMERSCALDEADRGGLTLEEVGRAMNLVRERVRQIEAAAIRRTRASDLPGPRDDL